MQVIINAHCLAVFLETAQKRMVELEAKYKKKASKEAESSNEFVERYEDDWHEYMPVEWQELKRAVEACSVKRSE